MGVKKKKKKLITILRLQCQTCTMRITPTVKWIFKKKKITHTKMAMGWERTCIHIQLVILYCLGRKIWQASKDNKWAKKLGSASVTLVKEDEAELEGNKDSVVAPKPTKQQVKFLISSIPHATLEHDYPNHVKQCYCNCNGNGRYIS